MKEKEQKPKKKKIIGDNASIGGMLMFFESEQ